jgi:hypothetical protein
MPPSVTSIHISSTNADPSRATAGDTVTLTFAASEKVAPLVLVETKTLFVRARNTEGNSWDASYAVNAKDRTGQVDYLLAMTDASGNVLICSSVHIPFIKYCPTTDGSSVTVYKDTAPPLPADTVAPVIAAHADVYATTTASSSAVEYALPAATDNVDASVGVSCAPASGSSFAVGTTTVACTAQDAAGNIATSSFSVVVEQVAHAPELYAMSSQPDESYLCGQNTGTWRYCDDAGTFSFTDTPDSSVATIDLGQGSGMGQGTIQTVALAKDRDYGEQNVFHSWLVTISCFTDSSHTGSCSDWPAISDTIHTIPSGDGIHWTANFSALNRTFNQDDYYVMTIDDQGWDNPAFGSESLRKPYWLITGLR